MTRLMTVHRLKYSNEDEAVRKELISVAMDHVVTVKDNEFHGINGAYIKMDNGDFIVTEESREEIVMAFEREIPFVRGC